MKHTKIAILGAGRVGTTTAYALMLKNIAGEILLVDIDPQRCKGEFLDLSDALSFSATSKIKDASLQEAAQADIIIITAGFAQKQGQTRLELLDLNKKVMDAICDNLKPLNPQAIIIVVSNPLDVLTLYMQQKKILPRNQIFGSGTYLDSIRLRGFIANKLGIAPESINAWILGEHGDSQFPIWSSAHIDGTAINHIQNLSQQDLDHFAQQTRQKAYDIIACKGSTFYGIASCIASLCQAIIFNEKIVVSVSFYQEEFDVCLSMPCILGEKGIEKPFPLTLEQKELELLKQSVASLKKLAI